MSTLSFPTVGEADLGCFRTPALSAPIKSSKSKNIPSFQPAQNVGEDDGAEAADQPLDQTISKPTKQHRAGSFPHLGLMAELCSALARKGYSFPTPIQRRVIPSVLAGRDVVAMARTGSGKTAAFLAPTLQRLAMSQRSAVAAARRNGPRALVLAPTRELALQTLRFAKAYGRNLESPIRSAVVVGGTPLEAHFEALSVCPELLIATPGRLLQIIAEMGVKGGLTMSTVEVLILDEADRLFEGTLVAETSSVIDQLSPESGRGASDRQNILISATMPHALAEFTRTFLRPNVDVARLDADKSISPTLAVAFLMTRSGDEKVACLLTVVRHILLQDAKRSLVVFASTHRSVEYLVEVLRMSLNGTIDMNGATPEEAIVCVHGSMDQLARVESVALFRKQKARVLVVTDVAARGIDLPDLDVVINFDMSATPKLFVHRVGRAGRAGRTGAALSLISADEAPYMIDTLLFLGRNVQFAGEGDEADLDPWKHHVEAMETSFIIGALPKRSVDEDEEFVNKALATNPEFGKLRQSAMNAQGLYKKTRATASGESVRRAKEMYFDERGGSRLIVVHPWFKALEGKLDRTACEQAALLSTWRPQETVVSKPRLRSSSRVVTSDHTVHGMNECSKMLFSSEDKSAPDLSVALSLAKGKDHELANSRKRSVRQQLLEEQRSQFFVPLRRNDSDVRKEKALKLGTGGAMGDSDADGFGAFRAVQAAKMNVNGDTNVDMLRERQQYRKNDMFWDRVSKKFVKGGVTNKTSKQNTHVATREARSMAKGKTSVGSYAQADGAMFKKWLSKNRKVVDELRETGNGDGHHDGFGSNDFRKGSYGRRARIAALVARKKAGEGDDGLASQARGLRSVRSELKPVAQIQKERKLQRKAEARRIAKLKGKHKGRSGSDSFVTKKRAILQNSRKLK